MKCVVKKEKTITELNDADRRAMRIAMTVCQFVLRNTDSEEVKLAATSAGDGLKVLLAAFAEPA